jgi:hypothetical protein
MARLLADEDFNQKVVVELRQLGHDVVTVQELGPGYRGIQDPDVLALAIRLGRAVLTHNRRHFIRLHQQVRPHFGILVCTRDDANVAALAARIHQAIVTQPSLADRLTRVNRPTSP